MDSDFIALETMIAAQETARWTLWMMFATWASGFATLSAVVVSLYLANRKPVSTIKSTCNTALISPGQGISMMGLSLNVANIGVFPVVISSITWVCGGTRTFTMLFNSSVSQKLPKKLEHGESSMFFIEFKDFVEWKKEILELIEQSDGKISKLKYVITLGTGQKITFKPDKELIKTLKS